MVEFHDLVRTGIAPVIQKKTAVKDMKLACYIVFLDLFYYFR